MTPFKGEQGNDTMQKGDEANPSTDAFWGKSTAGRFPVPDNKSTMVKGFGNDIRLFAIPFPADSGYEFDGIKLRGYPKGETDGLF